jgi:hypothetical protein
MALPHHNRARFCNLFLKVDWIQEIGELYPGRRLIRAHLFGMFSSTSHKTVILRACDSFDLFVFSACPTGYISPLNKSVILSEALRRSSANRALVGAESKDPKDAYPTDAVRPLSTTEVRTWRTRHDVPVTISAYCRKNPGSRSRGPRG